MLSKIPLKIQSLLFGSRYRRVRFYSAFCMYFLIVLLGSLPNARADVGIIAPGIVLHTVAYSIITFLLATGSQRNLSAASIQAILIVLVMGALDEYIQSYFPYRHGQLQDWLVDGSASVVTVLLLKLRSAIRLRN